MKCQTISVKDKILSDLKTNILVEILVYQVFFSREQINVRIISFISFPPYIFHKKVFD